MSKMKIKKSIIMLFVIMILIGAMPLQQVHAFNFQVDDSVTEEFTPEEFTFKEKPVSMLHKKLVLFFDEILIGLKQFFGLRTMDQMFYNAEEGKFALFQLTEEELEEKIETGEDPTFKEYHKGIMPEGWYNTARNMHLVFQAIAWSVLGLAIVKNLLQINLATINPMIRRRFYDAIRDLFIAGFLLVASLLIVETMLELNEKLVDIFKTVIPTGGFGSIHAERRDFTSFFVQAFYFGIEIYLNFIYVVRAISTAVLIATAPLFIISITFEGKNELLGKWAKEMVSNIFVQSFHAFIFSYILTIQLNSGGFENMVIMFSIIPLTELFKSLILGDSKGAKSKLGMGALSAGVGALSAGASGALEGNKRSKDSGGKSGNKTSENNSGSTYKSGSSFESNSGSEESNTSPIGGGGTGTSSEALNDLSRDSEDVASGKYSQKSTITNESGASVGKSLGKMAIGGVKVVGGAAIATAGFGLAAATGNKDIGRLAGKSAKTAFGGSKDIALGGRDVARASYDNSQGGNKGGNIVHQERTPEGDVAIHRDRADVSNDGLVDVASDSRKNHHTFTYDDKNSNMSQENKDRLFAMETEFSKSSNRSELKEKYGIENISRDGNGLLRVTGNKLYTQKMGIESMTKTNNRYIETKNVHQTAHTDIVPNLGFSRKGNSEATV